MRIDPVVGIKFAILDRLQRRGQQRRHLRGRDDDAIRAVTVLQRLDGARPGNDAQDLRRTHFIGKARRAQSDIDARIGEPIGAGPVKSHARPVLQAGELLGEIAHRQGCAGVELKRRCKHLRRQRPASPLELLGDDVIQMQGVERQRRDACQSGSQRNPYPQEASKAKLARSPGHGR